MIGMRSGASDTSSGLHVRAFGGSPPETRCTTSAPAFVGIPHWSFSFEGRRLPVVQQPHFQHHNVPSRNPYWRERCAELRPKGASPRSRGDLDWSRAGVIVVGGGATAPSGKAVALTGSAPVHATLLLALSNTQAWSCPSSNTVSVAKSVAPSRPGRSITAPVVSSQASILKEQGVPWSRFRKSWSPRMRQRRHLMVYLPFPT